MGLLVYILLLFAVPSIFAQQQGAHRLGQVLVKGNNIAANVGPYANITVCVVNTSCSQLATVYSDPSLTVPLANPVIADGNGNYNYYIAVGCVDEKITTPGQGQVFVPHVCPFNGISGSGGSPPAGVPQEIQTNANNTQFGTSKIFSDGSTSAYTPLPQWAQYARNSQKSAYCKNFQCGDIHFYGQDVPPLDSSNNATGYGQVFYNNRNALFTSLGMFDGYSGDSNDPAGGTVLKVQNDTAVFHTPSIGQDINLNVTCGKPGDCGGIYSYLWSHGGYNYASDEGATNIKANGGLSFQHQGGMVISGSPGTGATTVSTSTLYSPDDILVGGFVYDANGSPIATGNITAYDGGNHILTVTPGSITPATNLGTTTTPITITVPNAVTGVSITTTVHVTNGTGYTISNTSPIVFACSNPEIEFVVPTAVGAVDGSGNQTITANFFHGHSAGCTVAQGGTMGVLDLVADRIGNNWKTSYFVFGGADNSHLYEVSYAAGARGVINPWKHNFGGNIWTVNNAQITGDGTTTTACNLGSGGGAFSGQYVQISGASPSSFNGIYTASALNKNLCITMLGAGSGTATGATIAVGGAINSPDGTVQGPGGFKIWQTARIRQLGTSAVTTNGITTNSYNGTVYFYPNNFNFISGHNVLVLDDMQVKVEPLADVGTLDIAPNNHLNRWFTVAVTGNGVTGGGFIGSSIINNMPYSSYKGGGGTGQLDGATALSIEGPWANGIFIQATVQHGVGINMNPTTLPVGSNRSFFPLAVSGGGGGGEGFTINYDPDAGTTIIKSGTGNGVYTSILMTPNDFTMGAGNTGTFTLTGQTYKFSGLNGASTRALTVDSTGTIGTTTVGTVTSVAVSAPTWMGVTGSPITTSGTVTFNPSVFGASGPSHSVGIVPDPGASAGTTRFLREDGTWQLPTSGYNGTCAPTTTITVSNGLITGCS